MTTVTLTTSRYAIFQMLPGKIQITPVTALDFAMQTGWDEFLNTYAK